MAGYYFNLPPITRLTIPQQAAVNETRPIALSGGPGTGKSVVSLWRHINKYENGKRSLLLTYTTTLKQYLKSCCQTKNSQAAIKVGTSYKNRPSEKWSEIIIDEAQDLENSYFDDIKQYGNVSYGADNSQILYPSHCSTQVELRDIFPSNILCELNKNFRSTQRIMKFAKQAFPEAVIPRRTIDDLANNVGELPVLLISNGSKFDRTNSKQDGAIERIIDSFHADDHNIAVLVPWQSDVRVFENVLNEKGYQKGRNYSYY